MLEFILLAFIAGILAGTFTGLAPGIHINLIAALLLSSRSLVPFAPPIALAVFIVSMSITHTFLDFIPSIFLGAPEEDTFLAVLPGHEFLQEGKGYHAVVFTLYGSLFALLIALVLTPIFLVALPSVYTTIKTFIPYLLIFISIYLILRDQNKVSAIIVFLLSAFVGLITFNLPVKNPLTPLLTGLFGLSALIISLRSKTAPAPQTTAPLKQIRLSPKEFLKAASATFIATPLCSFLPGIGSGHAATIGSELIPQERKGFLFLTGAASTAVMALSFVTVYAIARARSGSAAAIQDLLQTITHTDIIIIMVTVLITGLVAFLLSLFFARLFARFINKINYSKLTVVIILILILLNILFSNWIGLIVLTTSTALGIFAILSNARRINLMGALIVPAIVYYLLNNKLIP